MLRIVNLYKRYKRNKNNQYALSNVSFQTKETGLVCIVGESGSGKTTLLNILGTLDKATSGHVYFNNEDIKKYSNKEKEYYRSKQIGFVFQEYNLFHHLTVRDNILISEAIQGEQGINYVDVLKLLDLEGLDNRYPSELSSGQKQRVAIARTLIKNPKMILADEPTGSLDEENATKIFNYLKGISESTLVIVVTHNMEFACKYADRILQIDHGRLVDDKVLVKSDSLSSLNQSTEQKLQKHLSFSMILKYMFSNIKTKKLSSLVLTLIISTVITILSVLTFIINYDNSKFTLESMKTTQEVNVAIKYRVDFYNTEFGNYIYTYPGQKQGNLNNLKNLFPYHHFYPIYKSYLYLNYEGSDGLYIKYKNNGMMEVDPNILNNLDFTLLAGKLPEKDENYIELAISAYAYQILYSHAVNFYDGSILVNSYQDILNQRFNRDNQTYIIVGIIDTKYNDNQNTSFAMKEEIYKNEIHNAFFTYIGYYDDIYWGNETDKFKVINENRDYFTFSKDGYRSNINFIKKLNNQNIIFREGYSDQNLSQNDVIVSFQEFNEIFDVYMDEFLINMKIIKFAQENYPLIKDEFEKDFGISEFQNYYTYILNNEKVNKYQPGYDYHYFRNLEIINHISSRKNYTIELTDFKNPIPFKKQLNIVGIIYEDDTTGSLYVSDKLYDELKAYNDGEIAYVTTQLTDSNADVNLFDYIYTDEDNYTFGNGIRFPIDLVKHEFNQLSSYYFYSWILLVSFTIMMIYYLSHTILRNEKRKIGLLAALGTKISDIFYIMTLEYTFLLLFILPVSLTASYITTDFINQQIKLKYSVQANAIYYNPIFILFISIVVIIISIVIYIVSIYKYTKRTPVSVMKNNR